LSVPTTDDIVMLYYPLDPSRSFIKRVVGREGDEVRIVGGEVTVNGVLRRDTFVPDGFRSHDNWGPQVPTPTDGRGCYRRRDGRVGIRSARCACD
jgi:signal peptidase I